MLKFNPFKVLAVLILAFVPFSAKAQFHLGGQFSINFSNEHSSYYSGAVTDKENEYVVNVRPKIYWNIGDKMQVGGKIGFAFGRMTTGLIYDSEKKDQSDIVNRALGWSLAPFFGYKLLDWNKISVWAEANAFLGQYYNVGKRESTVPELSRQTEYGFQILPVINFDLTEKLALQVHFGFISLGWYGTKSDYPNKIITTSTWDLHKGGFKGVLQGLADYGIGLVKTF